MLTDEQRKNIQKQAADNRMYASSRLDAAQSWESGGYDSEARTQKRIAEKLIANANALDAALEAADALAVAEAKVRWCELMWECALDVRRFFPRRMPKGRWIIEEFGRDLKPQCVVAQWAGTLADGYQHLDAIEAALKES